MTKFKIIYLKGNITLDNVKKFQKTISRLVFSNYNFIILNMEKTTFINKTGLEAIIKYAILARKRNKEIIITNIGNSLKEIFQTTAFFMVAKFFDSDKEAIEYLYQNNRVSKTK
ncbi:anti-anti-sigma factor [Anoxybacillus voinovskiensis]|uniref:Anti-anti-sigma factor n=1 Tax=Anoxybacteroides voinovskiense TaxID=230470 RepID=A0A840DJF7_9BACL|nr:STAS domain-containing protein [Anoxybacillus voinovskiensis]MBB4073441.1 anti-anti-sigma factor [Anoxybacillus voinovskiensis]GGJ61161.1 hypothetical protein GCM10008982_07880 [Anoxybacillus voinovskiensis]